MAELTPWITYQMIKSKQKIIFHLYIISGFSIKEKQNKIKSYKGKIIWHISCGRVDDVTLLSTGSAHPALCSNFLYFTALSQFFHRLALWNLEMLLVSLVCSIASHCLSLPLELSCLELVQGEQFIFVHHVCRNKRTKQEGLMRKQVSNKSNC